MPASPSVRSILITGAGGNLGQKLIAHLLAQDRCERIVAIDRSVPASTTPDPRVHWVPGDLIDPADAGWHGALADVDAAVHFAAQNPYPDAPWSDACASFDMTLALLRAASRAGVRRIVFASSNHVMGQYKDAPLAETLTPGGLTTSLPPGPGTRWFNGREVVQ